MRLFIGVEIPEEIKARLWGVAEKFDFSGVTLSRRENYHITMQFLGEVPESKLQDIKDSMSSTAGNSFHADVHGLSSFGDRMRVLFADLGEGSEELRSLYSRLGAELRNHGVACEEEKAYRPHVTLARVKFINDRDALASAFEKYSSTDFGSFVADSIFLKSSVPTPLGHLHQILYERKLPRQPAP